MNHVKPWKSPDFPQGFHRFKGRTAQREAVKAACKSIAEAGAVKASAALRAEARHREPNGAPIGN